MEIESVMKTYSWASLFEFANYIVAAQRSIEHKGINIAFNGGTL